MSGRAARRRRLDSVARAVSESLALDLRLEGVTPERLVHELGVSQRHAVAILDGHPDALLVAHWRQIADLAHVDLFHVLDACEARPAGDA